MGVFGGMGVVFGLVDVVMIFCNVYNWCMGVYNKDVDYSEVVFSEMYVMLKFGGVLGIEEYCFLENMDIVCEWFSGYIKVLIICVFV